MSGLNSIRCTRLAFASFGLLGSLALASPGDAATSTGTMAVSATVVGTCTVSSSPMAFGNYTGVNASGTATLTVQCTNTTSSTVGLGAGTFTGAATNTRRMTGGAVALAYGLYRDAGYTLNYGNVVGTDTPAAVVSTGAATTITVYGQILGGQYVAPGAYTDTVTATVTF